MFVGVTETSITAGKGDARKSAHNESVAFAQKTADARRTGRIEAKGTEREEKRRKGGHTLVCARLRLALAVHPGQGLRNFAEQGLDVVARLGRCLDKHDVELFRLLLGFFGRHLPVRSFPPVTASVTGGVVPLDQREREWRELRVNAPLVIQVSLVADEDDDHIVAALRSHVVDPLARVHERRAVWL